MVGVGLFLFSCAWLAVLFLFNSLFAGKFLRLEVRPLLTYVLTMAALGLFGEVALDTAYAGLFGAPLWKYHLFPIHHGYTSVYSLFLWGAVGFHLYFFHAALRTWRSFSLHALAFIFCVEAILLEALVNLSYLLISKDYIYYYLPSDLGHVTSLQTLPLYLLAGYVSVLALRYAVRLPKYAYVGNSVALIVLLISA